MKVEQKTWSEQNGWQYETESRLVKEAQLIIVFGPERYLKAEARYLEIKSMYPTADIVMGTSSESIINQHAYKDCIVLSAISFNKSTIQCIQINIKDVKDSFDAGAHLSAELEKDELKSLWVIADYGEINGAHLLTGLLFNLSNHIPITGGMASDSTALVGLNGIPGQGNVVGIGFSGNDLKVGHGIGSGWSAFGTERFITKSSDDIVYQIDKMTPFEFYNLYLDGIFDDIEESSRSFPLGINIGSEEHRLIRSVLSIDKETGAVKYAGNLNKGDAVRMMKSNVSRMMDAAASAGKRSLNDFGIETADFAILVNCQGRRNTLKEWSHEEIEIISSKLGLKTPILGFYSEGEICPLEPKGKSELHNMIITVTTFKED